METCTLVYKLSKAKLKNMGLSLKGGELVSIRSDTCKAGESSSDRMVTVAEGDWCPKTICGREFNSFGSIAGSEKVLLQYRMMKYCIGEPTLCMLLPRGLPCIGQSAVVQVQHVVQHAFEGRIWVVFEGLHDLFRERLIQELRQICFETDSILSASQQAWGRTRSPDGLILEYTVKICWLRRAAVRCSAGNP